MNDAKHDILNRIRSATQGETAPAIQRDYREHGELGRTQLIDRLVERLLDYRAVVLRCRVGEEADTVQRALASAGARSVLTAPQLAPAYRLDGSVTDSGESPAQLDAIDAVVTSCALAIAETGTLVLDHRDDGQGRRALTLIPDIHLCVVRSDQVVETVPEAVRCLDPHRHQTWISGPSATSDIELVRIEGVHGPRTLIVVIVDADAGEHS